MDTKSIDTDSMGSMGLVERGSCQKRTSDCTLRMSAMNSMDNFKIAMGTFKNTWIVYEDSILKLLMAF